MADDVALNKAAIIERCVARVREEYAGDEQNLLAMHLVRIRRLGVPQETREAFELLRDAQLLDPDLADRMSRMVGFRNVAVHDYRRLDLQIVKSIITTHLDDFLAFSSAALRAIHKAED